MEQGAVVVFLKIVSAFPGGFADKYKKYASVIPLTDILKTSLQSEAEYATKEF